MTKRGCNFLHGQDACRVVVGDQVVVLSLGVSQSIFFQELQTTAWVPLLTLADDAHRAR